MRVALLSDVHANLPALQAVLDSIGARSDIDAVHHLGDLVGYAPWPDEVVALLTERGITGVSGNYDSTVGFGYKHCGCRYEDPVQEALSHESFAWTRMHSSDETKRLLRALPFRLDMRVSGGHVSGPGMVLIHGAPTLNTLYWTEDRSDEFCLDMAKRAGLRAGDLIVFGHTHIPWHREIEGIHFVNTGSVGRPRDGDWRAGYVLATWSDGWSVEFERVAYDVDRTMAAIRASTLPAAFAPYLRHGGRVPPDAEDT